jgi:hypothetical protein
MESCSDVGSPSLPFNRCSWQIAAASVLSSAIWEPEAESDALLSFAVEVSDPVCAKITLAEASMHKQQQR